MTSPDANAETVPSPGMPSQQMRTIVTLLLIIHLFMVWLAIMTSSESGTAEFLRDIKERTPGVEPYLTQFWLDRGYDYYLMNDQNWDFQLQATVIYADGHTDGPILFPEPNLSPSERRQRYQQLATFVANYIARAASPGATELDAERKSLLPEAVGGGLIRQHPGAKSVSLKCIFHRGISREELRSENPKDRDPFDSQFFTPVGDLTIVMDRGRPTVFENLPPLEVSPVRQNAPKSKKNASSTDVPATPATSGK